MAQFRDDQSPREGSANDGTGRGFEDRSRSRRDSLRDSSGWIHELARAEIHPDAEKILQLGGAFDPQRMVEESTIQFLSHLKEAFTEFSKVFNSFSESGQKFGEIKIYNIAQTAADFMIYRSQVKLLISNSAHGVVQFAFARHVAGTLSVDGQIHNSGDPSQGNREPQEFYAQVGPFREIDWFYDGHRVDARQVAQFYFVEFVRASREQKSTRGSNQLLLEQLKSLLQEKGLDI